VIQAQVAHGGISLVGDLSPGSFAYVDADWLPSDVQPVPSVSVSAEGMAWCDEPPLRLRGDLDPDTAAALALFALAEESAAAIRGIPPVSVEVRGRGLIAQQVRTLIGITSESTAERPRAIVDMTGDPAVIVDATRTVADLGSVVLAGEMRGRRAETNLYPDVYMRGLTLVGVAPPLRDPLRLAEWDADADPVRASRESLARMRLAELLPADAPWYRVSAYDDARGEELVHRLSA
jgi:hypothetical protein